MVASPLAQAISGPMAAQPRAIPEGDRTSCHREGNPIPVSYLGPGVVASIVSRCRRTTSTHGLRPPVIRTQR